MRELEASLAAPEGERRFWVAVEDAMPQSGEIVLVSGGTAMHVDGVWYTGMEEPLFRRTINWPVTHWRPLPYYPQPQLLHPTKEKP
jgi:broad specificity phosphatase PhoE